MHGDGTVILDRANSHTGGTRVGIDNTTSNSATRVLTSHDTAALGNGGSVFTRAAPLSWEQTR